MNRHATIYILLGILALGLGLRLWNLSLPDIASDDALYSLRSVDYVDYVASTNKQSTPVSWFPTSQWWQSLSFHDAPPLVFITQWISFQLFGDNAVAARLPFVAAGVLAIYGAYLLGTLTAGTTAGLVAAATLAVSNYAIWISRIGYLEGFLVPEILFALYFFIKAKNAPKNYLWWGTCVGAGLLTKYTFLFMGPVFLVALLAWQRRAWKEKWFYAGCATILILISPIIIYNMMMFRTRGHVDAALSTLTGQHPEDFKVLTRVATKNFNIAAVAASLGIRNASAGFIALLLAALAAAAMRAWQRPETRATYALFGLGGLWALVMLGITSGDDHFGTVLLPFVTLVVGIGTTRLWQSAAANNKTRVLFITVVTLAGLWEIIFAAQSQLLPTPLIANPLLLAKNRPAFTGFAALESYVKNFYAEHPELSTIVIFSEEPQLAAYQESRIRAALAKNPTQPIQTHLLIFDDRMQWFPWVWIFERRRLYNFAPIHSLTQFSEKMRGQGAGFYRTLGFTDVTIITAANESVMTAIPASDARTRAAEEIARVAAPVDEIKNAEGVTVFNVFRLNI
ncbi:MAG: glycosyltransferase family 39 protein [bacterium]|nr:glycosyltransferase family 39 protein [bacterium]